MNAGIFAKKVGVVGLGYVGLPLALAALEANLEVYGSDISKARIDSLTLGVSPVDDVLDSQILEAVDSGRFHLSTQFEGLAECELVIICVPTPLDGQGMPDLSSLILACKNLAKVMKSGSLLINESTSYPGTLRNIIAPIFNEGEGDKNIQFAVAPERVDPGNKLWNFKNTPRVIGALSTEALNRAQAFYSKFCESLIPVSSAEVAELSKLVENSYRLVNIAFINEMASLSSRIGINIHEVLDAAETKPYGFSRFNPGLGVGGHCIPVDPMYLAWFASNSGQSLESIELSARLNKKRVLSVAERILVEIVEDDSVLVWGLSYKKGIADLRESPSIRLIEHLRKESISVTWFDSKIQIWNGEERESKIRGGVLIIVHDTDIDLLSEAIKEARLVFDLTGRYQDKARVIKL